MSAATATRTPSAGRSRSTASLAQTGGSLNIQGRKVPVSHLHKLFYPETGFTKANVIDYYIRVSPVLLPHLKDRPITLKRYPDRFQCGFCYEKRCPSHRP